MALTKRTVAQTLATAKAQVTKPTRSWKGWCLAFVRTAWGIAPIGIRDANTAWLLAKSRHTTGTPPAGAPVFWRVGKFGHAALSAGDGTVYSTDIRRVGKIDRVPITEITRRWRATYLGWTTDYAGRGALPGLVAPARKSVSLKAIRDSARSRPRGHSYYAGTIVVQEALEREYQVEITNYGKGFFGPRTTQYYAAWQRRCGYGGADADGVPGKKSLTKLANKYGFRVVD